MTTQRRSDPQPPPAAPAGDPNVAPRGQSALEGGGHSLAHPLPAGMRDLLPEEARRRRALGRKVLEHFTLHGYHLVTPPAFEFADVLERGLGTLDPSDVLRFVEPESGEVAALRPDMTPQIARMVATRLFRRPLPIRLCCEGTVVRRRQGRARTDRQIAQAGVELYGAPPPGGDLEMLRLAASVVRATGLVNFVVDVGHASVARALLEPLPRELGAELTDALVHKDASRIDELLTTGAGTAVPIAAARALAALVDLSGGGPDDPGATAVFARADAVLSGTPAAAALRELRALWQAALDEPELGPHLRVDLGEVRGFAYYTGTIFHVLAPGPGEPIAAGGRYDELLARFDWPLPAVGFALNLDALAWAREAAAVEDPPGPRVVCATGVRAGELADALRRLGVAAVVFADADPFAYASAWRFTHVATEAAGRVSAVRIASGGQDDPVDAGSGDPSEVAQRIATAMAR